LSIEFPLSAGLSLEWSGKDPSFPRRREPRRCQTSIPAFAGMSKRTTGHPCDSPERCLPNLDACHGLFYTAFGPL